MTSEEFLDAAMLGLMGMGPRESWILGDSSLVPSGREDRDTWARRVVDDALALANRRERVLAWCAAEDAAVGMTKRDLVMPPQPHAACAHDWGMAILTSNPPKRRCELCGFTEVVPGAEFVKGHEAPDAALDAEADALRSAFYGHASKEDAPYPELYTLSRECWHRVARKAREMHRRKASLEKCVKVYIDAHDSYGDGVRAVLNHLGVEVTP